MSSFSSFFVRKTEYVTSLVVINSFGHHKQLGSVLTISIKVISTVTLLILLCVALAEISAIRQWQQEHHQ